MLVIGGGDEGNNKPKSKPKLRKGFIDKDGHKTPISKYSDITREHLDEWGMPINDGSFNGSSHLSGNTLEEIEPDERLLRAFGSNAENTTSQAKGTKPQLLGIDLKNWCSNLNNPITETRAEEPVRNSWLVSAFKNVFGQSEKKIENQEPKLIDSKEDIPIRIRHIIEHNRQGDSEKVSRLSSLVGTNNATEINKLNTALRNNKPWAREFMDIFDPTARIDEALNALEEKNIFRAKLLCKDDLNKEQIRYLTSNPKIHEKFLSLVQEQRSSVPSSSLS